MQRQPVVQRRHCLLAWLHKLSHVSPEEHWEEESWFSNRPKRQSLGIDLRFFFFLFPRKKVYCIPVIEHEKFFCTQLMGKCKIGGVKMCIKAPCSFKNHLILVFSSSYWMSVIITAVVSSPDKWGHRWPNPGSAEREVVGDLTQELVLHVQELRISPSHQTVKWWREGDPVSCYGDPQTSEES